MAKPNENQIEILDYVSSQINYWKRTNDINSPTHQGDMEEEMWKIEELLSDDQKEKILESLNNLLTTIKSVQ